MRDRQKERERDGMKEMKKGDWERLLPGLIERFLCKWVHSAGAATSKREEQEKKRNREVNQCNKQGEGRSHELLMRTHFAWWGERQERKVSELPGCGGLLQKHTRTLMSVIWEGTLTRLACRHIQALAPCRNYGLELRQRQSGRDGSEQGRMGQCSSRQQTLRAVVGPLFSAVIVRWRCGDAEMCWEGGYHLLKVVMGSILKKINHHHIWQILITW